MVNILKSLNSKRFFLIENTNIKIFEDIISQLGNEVLRSNIKVEKNPRALVVSNAAIEWHQDSTEARWMAWYCLHPGTGKNEYTEILPLDQIVGGFSANDSAVFSKIKVKDRKSDGSENPKKLFEGNSLYYCPWLIEKENCSKGKIKKLKKVIGEAESASIKINWSAGTVLIIDNHWCLHRRPALQANSQRHLVRSWISERNCI